MVKIRGFSRNGRVIKVLLDAKVFYGTFNRLLLSIVTPLEEGKSSRAKPYVKHLSKHTFGWELYNTNDFMLEWDKSQFLLSASMEIKSDEYFIILYRVRPSHFKKLIAALEQEIASS